MTNHENDDPEPTLGDVLRQGRARAGLSVRGLSEQAGISLGQLSKLENGHVKKVNPAHLAAVAGPLELPISRLYAAAGYTVTELADHESDLVEKLKGLSPEAFQNVVNLVEDYLAFGPDNAQVAFVPVEIDEPNNDTSNE